MVIAGIHILPPAHSNGAEAEKINGNEHGMQLQFFTPLGLTDKSAASDCAASVDSVMHCTISTSTSG
jgi:hypothetical protein